MREKYPGKSDTEAARAYAQEQGHIAIVRYKNSTSASDFTNIGTCQSEEEIQGYLRSACCLDVEIIYDGRASALRITEELILGGHCELCERKTTRETLQLRAGNDFYICPKCGRMFCDACYVRLPLTSSPGYGTCPTCRIKVQRAIVGYYGEQSGFTDQARTGETSVAKSNETDDWSRIALCNECGAGNPGNATECIRCEKKLSLRAQHSSAKPVTPREIVFVSGISNRVLFRGKKSSKKKWWQNLSGILLITFKVCLSIVLLGGVILLLLGGVALIAANIYKVMAFIVFLVVGSLLFAGFAYMVNYLIESGDVRAAKRDARIAELDKKDMRKKQIRLGKEAERIAGVIKKKIGRNKPLESILPKMRTRDHEALAQAISAIDFVKGTDKGLLFTRMDSDFISKVLTYCSESDEIVILRQIEPKEREYVLLRCSLSKRQRIESALKKSEVSLEESA
jgi:ribosomal protein L40E